MKGKIMKKTKTDPVKDFQKQAVEQRVCLFYVADRVKSILEDNKNNNDKIIITHSKKRKKRENTFSPVILY